MASQLNNVKISIIRTFESLLDNYEKNEPYDDEDMDLAKSDILTLGREMIDYGTSSRTLFGITEITFSRTIKSLLFTDKFERNSSCIGYDNLQELLGAYEAWCRYEEERDIGEVQQQIVEMREREKKFKEHIKLMQENFMKSNSASSLDVYSRIRNDVFGEYIEIASNIAYDTGKKPDTKKMMDHYFRNRDQLQIRESEVKRSVELCSFWYICWKGWQISLGNYIV